VYRVLAVGVLLAASAATLAQEAKGPLPPPGGKLVLEDFQWCEAGKQPRLWTKWGKPEGMKIEAALVGDPQQAARPEIAMVLSGKVVKGGRDAMQVEAARDLHIPAVAAEFAVRLSLPRAPAGRQGRDLRLHVPVP
jgi:hypothetical protein